MARFLRRICVLALLLLAADLAYSQTRRKVIINEDAAGPGGTNMQALLVLIQCSQVEVLGITVVTGDQWRDEEVAHTLRLLELIGRTDIPVMSGAAFPLLRNREDTKLWEQRYGKIEYKGAWDERWWHEPFFIPTLPEGQPKIKAAQEDAAHFLVRKVRKYPHQVTIYEGGPMTNLALAISLDSGFAALARELVFMGGSLNPDPDYPEFAENPRHEFNFWFDPEAAHIVLRAPWRKIVCTPTDISLKARLSPQLVKRIGSSRTAAAQYVQRFYHAGSGSDVMWDELAAAAWIDPTLITRKKTRYMSVDIDKGAGYGNTLIASTQDAPEVVGQTVEIQLDLDTQRFYDMFAALMQAPTPRAPNSGPDPSE
ncbi:MAG: nucleoside hydrolase [Acidobacteriota bacterium]|nr:nucleoside hydrolase [Acidobacteriota bacterium]